MHPKYKAIVLEASGKDKKAMDNLQECMDLLHDALDEETKHVTKTLDVSEETASLIVYLRSRSRWSQEKEDHLIHLDQTGQELPNVLAGEF